ncbi:hypothetical protein [Streptomyces sp. NPDC059639]|uniref:hypothetical protein n=1 Tax=Streptomyces sp. NPDC059639 TaxID=3346891 RepID=UPI0036C18F0B
MSGQSKSPRSADALIPRPAVTVEALRAAVDRLDPEQTVVFDRELSEVNSPTSSALPVRTFLTRWALWVERYRVPATAARIRELEVAMGAAKTDVEARAVATGMSGLLHRVSADLALR